MEQSTISEKSRVSMALLIVVAPLVWLFAGDHNALAALASTQERDRAEVRADLKEIKQAVLEMRLQMSRRQLAEERAHAEERPRR